eukprot:TRINITY_DN6846_c0_g1_i1.p1 TRINITY_DN6846_c0_g1~~TRINITY_DN6846_c0_g1_i1.p1  ORF type:complete len:212 (+),score=41.61 TRINITY_DN6846_c0_g1_i1:42-638(+)
MAPVMKVKYLENIDIEEPMSRTDQYKKVMKPLLERKRRARINACLDELKDLMVYALQAEGESISKLEKADVLELTVRHLRKLKRQQMLAQNPGLDLDRFHAGYTACATEVSKCLASTGVDISVGSRLMSHLGHKLNSIETSRVSPLTVRVPTSPSSDCGYSSGAESSHSPTSSLPSPGLLQISPAPSKPQHSPVWRPF